MSLIRKLSDLSRHHLILLSFNLYFANNFYLGKGGFTHRVFWGKCHCSLWLAKARCGFSRKEMNSFSRSFFLILYEITSGFSSKKLNKKNCDKNCRIFQNTVCVWNPPNKYVWELRIRLCLNLSFTFSLRFPLEFPNNDKTPMDPIKSHIT